MDAIATPKFADVLPKRRDLYYGGKWQKPGGYSETINPATASASAPRRTPRTSTPLLRRRIRRFGAGPA
jgi:hypothetical protein